MKKPPKFIYVVLDRSGGLDQIFARKFEADKYRREMNDYLPDGAPHRVVTYVPREDK